jgi:hypothetical protein
MNLLLGRRASPLGGWEARSLADGSPRPRDHRDRYERDVRDPGAFDRIGDAILRYDIFPPGLVTPVLRRAPVEVGDTVGARFHLAPGVALFFASRVVEIFTGSDRRGFTYRTLEGHPELGEETFLVERIGDGVVRVSLRSWSRPGIALTKVLAPALRAIQVRASRRAVRRLAVM